MIELMLVFALAIIMVGIALSGLGTDKHFIVIMLGIELILVASTIVLVAFFSYATVTSSEAIVMLISIWAVAAVEIITLITFYIYMKFRKVDFDVTKLTRMKW